ncbi:MAG: DUF308 domain-containing protein [Chloroflexi bacterium]|nr:DUF308 domain-containing protein [Chloroflexota bacterium]
MSAAVATLQKSVLPWWVVLIEGIAVLILGVLLITNTAATLVTLVTFLGAWWLVQGIMDIVGIFIDHTAWGWKLFSGILGIIAGLIILQHPIWSTLLVPTVLVSLLGFMGLVMGAVGIVRAFQGDGWPAAVLGLVSILFGLFLIFNPAVTGLFALPLVLGVFAIVGGIIAIFGAFRIRSAQK